jgi:small subunit ribosomal protein S4
LIVLESRLDNVVYRLGFADSRPQARQLVQHGHFVVNGYRTNIPSYLVRPQDTIVVREGSRKRTYFKERAQLLDEGAVPHWLSLDPGSMAGRVLQLPAREDIPADLKEQLVVEYYSR